MNLANSKEKIAELLNKYGSMIRDLWSKVITIAGNFRVKEPRPKNYTNTNRYTENQDSIDQDTETAGVSETSRTGLAAILDFLKGRFLEAFNPGNLPVWKKRLMFFGFGGMAALLLILLIATIALNFGKSKDGSVQNLASGPAIPPEELFIPAEPDFVPQFLPEREPRSFWSLDDIRPYWENPGNSELWQEEIKTEVDKLMEGVP